MLGRLAENVAEVNGKTGALMGDVQEDIFRSIQFDDDPNKITSQRKQAVCIPAVNNLKLFQNTLKLMSAKMS